jgi:hypothetical protein
MKTIIEAKVQQVPVPMHKSSLTNMSRASHSGSSNGSILFLHNKSDKKKLDLETTETRWLHLLGLGIKHWLLGHSKQKTHAEFTVAQQTKN